jgi:hypothetical protein
MKTFAHWKLIVLTGILPLLAAWQPVITIACAGCGSHGGG